MMRGNNSLATLSVVISSSLLTFNLENLQLGVNRLASLFKGLSLSCLPSL